MINNKHYLWLCVEDYIANKTSEKDYYSDFKSEKPHYSITMPPPNVTGSLHIGHALVTTLQDSLVRYKRMKGYDVKWQPGLDHAGIATQVLVEKKLKEEQSLTRHELGREKFLEKVYEWKEESGYNIINQIRKLGSSCDFSYLAFTMDDNSVKAVNHAFIELYKANLIYQDDRLVNWDCKLQTAISDLEVEQVEKKGFFYYLRYFIKGTNEYIVVGTTRPETLFGDVAVAVNKEDKRYSDLVGKTLITPISNREITIIVDEHADMEKGSGAVKITPGHDFNDFEVGKRHNLEIINILNKDGTLNEFCNEEYIGLNVTEARKKIIEDLQNKDLIEKIDDAIISVPIGDRSSSVIEPMLTKQWFVDAEKLSYEAIDVVKKGDIKFFPSNWSNLYFNWLENIKPWCISRQLWWGHRIPVWYSEEGKAFCAENEIEAYKQAEIHYGEKVELKQDEDVLDTWFSSALWPFSTLKWPSEEFKDLEKAYFPTDVLVTGFDIIFFWVARMVMMSLFFTKKVPFKHVYINALIRDEKGQKMSKSKGNVINPLEIIEKYGTDALRFTLVQYSAQGRDIKLSEKTIEGNRNFVTKIWNSFKFCLMSECKYSDNFIADDVNLPINKWILNKIHTLQENINSYYDQYLFNDISSSIYSFFWKDFCDNYLEFAKVYLYNSETSVEIKTEIQHTMGFAFDRILKIIHPVMPFISQFLYETLHNNEKINLSLSDYPNDHYSKILNDKDIANIDDLILFISKIRSIKADYNIPQSAMLNIYVKASEIPNYLKINSEIVSKLAKVSSILEVKQLEDSHIQDLIGQYSFSIPLEGLIDIDKEHDRLSKAKLKIEDNLSKLEKQLSNKNFLEKGVPSVIENFKKQKEDLTEKHVKLLESYNRINNLRSSNAGYN